VARVTVLSVNASDPTGYGGLESDLRTFAAHDVHGASIVSAVGGPSEHFPMPGNVVGGQLSMALAEFRPAAAKVGMIATAEIAAAVGQRMRSGELAKVVLDPVLDTAGGHRRGVIAAIMRLLPEACVVTPNIDEAGDLVGYPVITTTDMAGAAAQLISRGAKFVVITGGRLSGDESIDAVWTDGGVRFLHAPRVETSNVRGTGSSFSAAIAASLALGADVHEAVTSAKTYVSRALRGSREWQVGHHSRPLDNLCLTAAPTPQLPALPGPRRSSAPAISGPPMIGKRSGIPLPAA
jgi:hydroxymethylpyrimidine/phosphomethylpyrimidine kinase